MSNFDSNAVNRNGLIDVAPMMININWSIAIEEQFYLFWPVLLLISGAKRFWIIITLFILGSWASNVYFLSGPELYYHTFSRSSDLAIGALVAYLTIFNTPVLQLIKKMSSLQIILVYLLGFAYLMYGLIPMPPWFPHRIFISIFFAFIILEQNFADSSFYKFGNNKILSSLGKYSYSLYLLNPIGIQVSVLTFRFLTLNRADGFYYGLLYALIAFAVTIILSMISYKYIEVVFLNLKRRFSPST